MKILFRKIVFLTNFLQSFTLIMNLQNKKIKYLRYNEEEASIMSGLRIFITYKTQKYIKYLKVEYL